MKNRAAIVTERSYQALPEEPVDREAVFAALAPLLPALWAWKAKWQAEHPHQTITERWVTKPKISEEPTTP